MRTKLYFSYSTYFIMYIKMRKLEDKYSPSNFPNRLSNLDNIQIDSR